MAYKRISPQPVVEGGTGVQSNTAYAVLCGGTTTTNPIQSIASVGNAGQVLTSNGAGALPTFQSLPSTSISITGDTGGALTGAAFTFTGGTTGLSFGGAATTQTLTFAGATINAGVVNIGSDSVDNAINIGTAANAGRTVTIGNATGTSSVAINCGTGGVTVGTSANAHSTTVGSTNSTSSTTVQSGSGALDITSTNGALTINSGTGTLGISTDASATTVNIATGAAAKTVTLGSTNTTSSLALKYGTSDFTLASATGTVMSALDTGEITYPLQPAFSAYSNTTQTNVTGDGTIVTVNFDTETYDQNGDYNNSTYTFTAPVAGKYSFSASIYLGGSASTNTVGTIYFVTTGTTYQFYYNPYAIQASNGILIQGYTIEKVMAAGDTCYVQVGIGTSGKGVDINAGAGFTWFSGKLIC